MVLLRSRGLLFSVPFAVIAAVVFGCARKDSEDDLPPGPPPRRGGGATAQEKPIRPGTATLRGRITVTGAPDLAPLTRSFQAALEKSADHSQCLDKAPANQKQEQDWRVGSDGGLAQVFVYLRPPAEHYFQVDPDDPRIKDASLPTEERKKLFDAAVKEGRAPELSWKTSAVIDQPHCVYIPHAQRFLPSYRDLSGNEIKGVQSLLIENTGVLGHNVKSDKMSLNLGLSGGKEYTNDYLKADYSPYTISCTIHPWMNANILVLDHPYSAITNEKGEFEIKNVPEGKMRLIVWHGSKLGFINENKARGADIELKKGDVTEYNKEVKFEP